jgi:hypothetical protein
MITYTDFISKAFIEEQLLIHFIFQGESRLVSYKLIHLSDDQAKAFKHELGGIYAKLSIGKGSIE